MKTEIKTRGISFTARNVSKVMDGSKPQTRRIEAQLKTVGDYLGCKRKSTDRGDCFEFQFGLSFQTIFPNHQVGDILYVKEALQNFGAYAIYKASSDNLVQRADKQGPRLWESDKGEPWKCQVLPARYMPRSAARTFLKVTDVRCERIQDISYEDCVSEGLKPKNFTGWGDEPGIPSFPEPDVFDYKNSLGEWDLTEHPQTAFSQLWDDTNGKGAWDRNDWCFAYTYELTKKP